MKALFGKLLVAVILLGGFTVTAFADALDHWTPCVVSTNSPYYYMGFTLTGAAYGSGRYVAVGEYVADDTGVVEASNDGTNWVITSPVDDSILDLYDVAFANGTFVACGWDYYDGNNLYNSTNGTNWTSHTAKISNFFRVIYGSGLFVAVGDGLLLGTQTATNKNIYTSPDGVNWTARASGAPANDVDSLSDVAYGAGTYVAVSGAYFHTSTTGVTWTRTASSYPLEGNISFCNGLFFAPVGLGTNLVSANGTTWSVLTNNTAALFGRIIYTNGLYLALSNSWVGQSFGLVTGPFVFTSTDGTNWVRRIFSAPTNTLLAAVVFENNRVVAVGYQPTLPLWQISFPCAFISDPLVGLGISSGFPPQLNISGVSNLLYSVQYSTSLNPASWQTLANLTLTNGPSVWTDGTATNSQRFYRVGWP